MPTNSASIASAVQPATRESSLHTGFCSWDEGNRAVLGQQQSSGNKTRVGGTRTQRRLLRQDEIDAHGRTRNVPRSMSRRGGPNTMHRYSVDLRSKRPNPRSPADEPQNSVQGAAAMTRWDSLEIQIQRPAGPSIFRISVDRELDSRLAPEWHKVPFEHREAQPKLPLARSLAATKEWPLSVSTKGIIIQGMWRCDREFAPGATGVSPVLRETRARCPCHPAVCAQGARSASGPARLHQDAFGPRLAGAE